MGWRSHTGESGVWHPQQVSRGVSLVMPACSGRVVSGFGLRPMNDKKIKTPMTEIAMAAKIKSFFVIKAERLLATLTKQI